MSDYIRIQRWESKRFLESRLDSIRKNRTFAALCTISPNDFRVHIELPPSSRLTGLAYREVVLSERFSYYFDFDIWGGGMCNPFHRLHFSGTIIRGFLSREEDAIYTLMTALNILRQDSTGQRHEAVLEKVPRELVEQNQIKLERLFNSEGNLGTLGLRHLPAEIRKDFGLPPIQKWPADDWQTVRDVYRAAMDFHWEQLGEFDEIVCLEETQPGPSYGLDFLMEQFKTMQPETANDFASQSLSGTDFRLPEPPSLESGICLVSPNRCWSYSRFHEVYPNSQGILAFSVPGFNQERTEALVSVKNHVDLGLLCSANVRKSTLQLDSLLLLRKHGGNWTVEESYTFEDRLLEQALHLQRWDFTDFENRRPITELPELLKGLIGFSESDRHTTLPRRSGEIVLGSYNNRRFLPKEILFTQSGLLIKKKWSDLHIPYSSLSSASSLGRFFEVNLNLTDGRVVPIALDGFRKGDNPHFPQLDSDWFCRWLPTIKSLAAANEDRL